MPSEKPARRLRDILENADAIARYTEGMDLGAFTADAKTRDAVERCLERISEAARKRPLPPPGEGARKRAGDVTCLASARTAYNPFCTFCH